MIELFENSGDPDLKARSAASYLGLHYLSVTRLGVSILQWVKENRYTFRVENCHNFCPRPLSLF